MKRVIAHLEWKIYMASCDIRATKAEIDEGHDIEENKAHLADREMEVEECKRAIEILSSVEGEKE